MLDVRTYVLGDEAFVVKVRGHIDDDAVAVVAHAARAAAVIDLRDALLIDLDALDALVARTDAIFVAQRPLRDALEAIAAHNPVRTASSLAEAFA